MSQEYLDVKELWTKFGLQIYEFPILARAMEPEVLAFRLNHLAEELSEYETAHKQGDFAGVTDALIDFVYLTYGTALGCGVGLVPTWPEPYVIYGKPRGLLGLSQHLASVRTLRGDVANLAQDSHDPVRLIRCLHAMVEDAYLAAARMAIPWRKCWAHVHAANMAKVRSKPDGSDSPRGCGWDIIKPPGWVGPEEAIRRELQYEVGHGG